MIGTVTIAAVWLAFLAGAVQGMRSDRRAALVKTARRAIAEVKDALRYGTVQGYFDREGERYQLTWNWFRAITRLLKRRHLIFTS